MEEDICFPIMLSLVSRDHCFQLRRGCCWMSCAGAVFCAFKRYNSGWEWVPFHRSLNDNTLAVIYQLSRAVFTLQMQVTTWKRHENLFSGLKSLQLSLCAVILSCIDQTFHKKLNWSKILITRRFCGVFFFIDDNWMSHDINLFLKYPIFKELNSPHFLRVVSTR